MKHLVTKTMYATILFLSLWYAYTGFDGFHVSDPSKVMQGLIMAIVAVVIIIKLEKYE